jgi:hypothetical protein
MAAPFPSFGAAISDSGISFNPVLQQPILTSIFSSHAHLLYHPFPFLDLFYSDAPVIFGEVLKGNIVYFSYLNLSLSFLHACSTFSCLSHFSATVISSTLLRLFPQIPVITLALSPANPTAGRCQRTILSFRGVQRDRQYAADLDSNQFLSFRVTLSRHMKAT